jgi:hypothetical protein
MLLKIIYCLLLPSLSPPSLTAFIKHLPNSTRYNDEAQKYAGEYISSVFLLTCWSLQKINSEL